MKKDYSKYIRVIDDRPDTTDFGPPVIYLESVKGCPFSCAMCHFKKTKPVRMSLVLLERIEPYFKDLEVLAIHGQGEPLLGDIEYFVGQSVRHDFVLHMNTTGLLLTKDLADSLLKTRLSIRFSIHSGTPETYRKIMGNDLERIRENISYLVKESKLSKKEHDFWLSFIVMKQNIDEVEDFLRFAHECGICSVRFQLLKPNWQTLKGVRFKDRNFTFRYFEQNNRHIRKKFIGRLPRIKSLSEELGINIEFGSFISQNKKPHPLKEISNTITTGLFSAGLFPVNKIPGDCLAPWIGQPVINQAGNVSLCCSTNYSLGNLYESTLTEIWNSFKMKSIRKSFREGYNPRACGYCHGFNLTNYPKNSFKEAQRERLL